MRPRPAFSGSPASWPISPTRPLPRRVGCWSTPGAGSPARVRRRSGRLVAAVAELELILGRTGQVVAQTRSRLGGVMPASATRLVSLHDPDARPIAKGRLGKPVEFGYKAQVVDNVDGIVLDHSVHLGNPADAPLLAPAIGRIQTLFGRVVRAVTADRGYGEAKIEQELHDLGVTTVVIPRKGKPGQARRRARARPRVPPAGQVAHRIRGPHLLPQAPLRLGPHPVRHPGRRADLVRARRPGPQQCQDRPPDPGQPAPAHPRRPSRSTPTQPDAGSGPGRDRAATRSAVPHRRLTHAPWSIRHARTAPPHREDTPTGAETAPESGARTAHRAPHGLLHGRRRRPARQLRPFFGAK